MTLLELGPAATRMADLVRAITDDQLTRPTPCPDYTVGDLVDHVGGLSLAFTAAAAKDGTAGAQGPSGDASRLGVGWRSRIPGQLAALADDRPLGVLDDLGRRVPDHEIDTGRRCRNRAKHRVQRLAPQADRRVQRHVGVQPSRTEPHRGPRRDRARLEHPIRHTEAIERRLRPAENEVSAQCFVRICALLPLDEGNPQPGRSVEHRGGAAGNARSDDDDVVGLVSGCHGLAPFVTTLRYDVT